MGPASLLPSALCLKRALKYPGAEGRLKPVEYKAGRLETSVTTSPRCGRKTTYPAYPSSSLTSHLRPDFY